MNNTVTSKHIKVRRMRTLNSDPTRTRAAREASKSLRDTRRLKINGREYVIEQPLSPSPMDILRTVDLYRDR